MDIKKIIARLKQKQKIDELNKCNNIQIPKKSMIYLDIKGKNNTVIIKDRHSNQLKIHIYGDNNTVIINENVHILALDIYFGAYHESFGRVCNSSFTIGENTSIEGMKYITYNSNTFCSIGKNCMISYDVDLYNTDGHPIFDKETGEMINKVKGITIGDHCWLGSKVSILKNSTIPENSIVGWGTVFSGGKFTEPDCVYAGNPAKLIRSNITWDVERIKHGYT